VPVEVTVTGNLAVEFIGVYPVSRRWSAIWFREEQIPVPKAKSGTAGEEIVLGVADQRKNPSDAEQPVLCRGVRVR
jgi:hypothetical protein